MKTTHSMPNVSIRALCLGLILALLTVDDTRAAGRAVRMNLGTLAPRRSSYHKALMSMAQEWRDAPDGGVRLVIYPDGTQGGEADMVRLMRIGSLQAGLFTAVGLADIEPAVSGLQNLPLMFRDLAEFEYVNEQLRPTLAKRMEEKGFVVLFWVDAGWVRFFSKRPIHHPADLKTRKIFTWAGDPEQVKIMRAAGYHPVPLETADILPGLATGLIDVVPAPPIFALAGQMDKRAPHMLDLNWAPLVGALVARKDAWEKLSVSTRVVLLASAQRAGLEIRARSRKESDDAVEAMKKRGLTVHPVTPDILQEWRNTVETEIHPRMRGTIVPSDIFDEVVRLLHDYRNNKENAGKPN